LLRVAGVLCAAGAVTFGFMAVQGDDPAAVATVTPAGPRTPAFSPRRVPVLFDDVAVAQARAAAIYTLNARLTAAVAPYAACVAVDIDGRPVARIGDDRALAPASTLKILTAAAALVKLGPSYHFRTTAYRSGNDLVLVGGGDPLLATPDYVTRQQASPRYGNAPFTMLANLAGPIALKNKQFDRVLVDDRHHEGVRFLPDWKPSYATDGEIGALGGLVVDGGFSDPVRRTPAADPAITTGQRFVELLQARGVTVTGGVARGAAPSAAPELGHVDSAPLSDVVGEMLRSSDNFTAEQVLRETGGGTTAAGRDAVRATLAALHVPAEGIELYDGSGLAPKNRVHCNTLLGVVEQANENPTPLAGIDRGLPVAGRSGTLSIRFLGDALAGRLRAKTGSINGVVGLTGDIDGRVDPQFAFLANGSFSTRGGQELQDAVARAIDAYPVVQPPAGLVPAP
jgi:D-alanyl-D-alanine carboxypeptidase/D-alanyl-D-alanine-endopeptidase (penicillin-binding protein 4)